jgi:Ca2+-binding EF-hand superfamily protein
MDAKDLAKMHWILSSELILGSEFQHAVAKKYPRLMPTKLDQSVKRYVILTHEAMFFTWYAPRKRKSGSSSASKDAEDEIIAELVKQYDTDGSGGLDVDELGQFLQEAGGGKAPTQDELLWVMHMATPHKIKKNALGQQELKIEHLRAAALAYSEYRQREAELDEIFDKYDDNDNGVLDHSEMTNMVTDYLTDTDAQKNTKEELSEEQRYELEGTRPERVNAMVQKLLEASGEIKEDGITKPEMIKALVMIKNEGKAVEPEVEEDRSKFVIKLYVKLDINNKKPLETRSEQSFKEAVEKAAYDVYDLTTGASQAQVLTRLGGEQQSTSAVASQNGERAGVMPRAGSGAGGGATVVTSIPVRDLKVSVHIPYTETLVDEKKIEEIFRGSNFELHFTVIVDGDLHSISNFKLSKRKLSKRLNDAGWSVKGMDEIFSYFPETFEVFDVLPLTEMVTPLIVDRMPRISRNNGLADIMRRMWKSLVALVNARRDRSKKPVALSVMLSLPMKAHNLNKKMRTELALATCKALNAAAKSVQVHGTLDPSRVQIRNVRSIAAMQPVDDQGSPSTAAEHDEFEYKWDLFISYRVTSDSDLVEKLYDKIMQKHPTMRVFLDKRKLVLGEAWDQGFADAITHSRVVVLVMSRGTFSCPHGKTCVKCPNNVARLEHNPDAEDNVILEYDLALEMFEMGRVKRIVPLFIGDQDDDSRLGNMYLDFFDKFKPCLCWDAIPDWKACAIQKRACHILSKIPELKVQLDASKDRNLTNKKLREGIPSLLRGRTVKQTLNAMISMQGIKLVGLPDSSISEACKRLGETAWDLRLLDENKEVDHHHGPKMDHTSVEILVDAFHKSHMHQQVSSLLHSSRSFAPLLSSSRVPPLSRPLCFSPLR